MSHVFYPHAIAGIKEVGGATIVYRTRSLRDASSWRYDGLLCIGDGETGKVWECPLIAQLGPLPTSDELLGSSHHTRLALGSRRSLTHFGSGGIQHHQQQAEAAKDPRSPKHSGVGGIPVEVDGRGGHMFPYPLSHPEGGIWRHGNEPVGDYDDRYTHFYSISPDACTNPTIYWLGRWVPSMVARPW